MSAFPNVLPPATISFPAAAYQLWEQQRQEELQQIRDELEKVKIENRQLARRISNDCIAYDTAIDKQNSEIAELCSDKKELQRKVDTLRAELSNETIIKLEEVWKAQEIEKEEERREQQKDQEMFEEQERLWQEDDLRLHNQRKTHEMGELLRERIFNKIP